MSCIIIPFNTSASTSKSKCLEPESNRHDRFGSQDFKSVNSKCSGENSDLLKGNLDVLDNFIKINRMESKPVIRRNGE
jgi:hypothetical protein